VAPLENQALFLASYGNCVNRDDAEREMAERGENQLAFLKKYL
jgi:hypothetical protein